MEPTYKMLEPCPTCVFLLAPSPSCESEQFYNPIWNRSYVDFKIITQ